MDLFTRFYNATKPYAQINAHVVRHLDAGYTGTSDDWSYMSRHLSSYLNRLIIDKCSKLPKTKEHMELNDRCRTARSYLGDIGDEVDIEPWMNEFKTELLPILVRIW